MTRKNDDDDICTINQLVLRVMKLMDEMSDIRQHINGLNNQIMNLTQAVNTQLNSLGKYIQECQTKQAELEKVFVKDKDLPESKIN